MNCLEDFGIFCVDNLPPPLIPKFAELCERSIHGIQRAALGIDIRERDFLDECFAIFENLRGAGHSLEVLFLEARDEVLVRRFSETRRPHPLARGIPLIEGIRLERRRLEDLRKRSDLIIDTSDYTVHRLRDVMSSHFRRDQTGARLHVTLVSFGFKFGIPCELDLLFDVRFLANPNFVEGLRHLDGRDSGASLDTALVHGRGHRTLAGA